MTRRAFTLTELLIAMIVVGIVGAVLVAALFSFFASYAQTEDYTIARTETEEAFQTLSAQLGHAGLGMPNNRGGQGSFASAFAAKGNAPEASIMTSMGEKGKAWGGPVTVASGDLSVPANRVTAPISGYYSGQELYYAWSVPQGVLVQRGFGLSMRVPPGHFSAYDNYSAFTKEAGFWTGDKLDLKWLSTPASAIKEGSWLVFPSFGVPLWVKKTESDGVEAIVAPGADSQKVLLGGALFGFEEVHRVHAARLRVDGGNLVQEIYEAPPQSKPSRTLILARGVAGVWFRFNPTTRELSMSLAARGVQTDARTASGKRPLGWPAGAPDLEEGLRHRILVENLTWRIRN